MEKLIDAAELKKQFADTDWETNNAICKIIDEQKPVDAVPVIRCKDCKYWSTETEQTAVLNMHKCTWWRTIGTLPIDFCSRAERRGEHGKID